AALLETLADEPARELQELRRMAALHGRESHPFGELGRVPVEVYAAWRSIALLDEPQAAVRAAQDLLDRHGAVQLGEQTAGERALDALRELVARHGADVLAAIEADATAALESAAADPLLLQRVHERFPLTAAGRTAAQRVIEVALERGDPAAAIASYAELERAGEAGPGASRRMVEALRRIGNQAFAHALAARPAARHGAGPSDLPPGARRS